MRARNYELGWSRPSPCAIHSRQARSSSRADDDDNGGWILNLRSAIRQYGLDRHVSLLHRLRPFFSMGVPPGFFFFNFVLWRLALDDIGQDSWRVFLALRNFSCPFYYTRAFILILERPWNFGKFIIYSSIWLFFSSFFGFLGLNGINWGTADFCGDWVLERLDQNLDLSKTWGPGGQ